MKRIRLLRKALPTLALGAGLISGLTPSLTYASEMLPRWELGLGFGGLVMPDYRGSDESRAYVLPFPYAVYRIDWLTADRNGVRATLFDSDRVELNMSLSASPPVRSKNNQARSGMPDIKPMLEFGPSLDFNLWRNAGDTARLDLRLPVRTAVTVQSSPQSAGWVFSPRVNLDLMGLGAGGNVREGWRLGLVAGPMFGDRRQHAYYYDVDQRYARSDRPAYASRGGYAGTQFLVSLSRKIDNMWLGAYARWDTLKGAVFEDSPLVKRSSYASAGFAVSWTLGQSADMVEVRD